jgi:hypothetical protein
VLRRRGDTRLAEQLDRCADEAAAAAEDYIRWLTEDKARLRSGWSRARLRAHYAAWERQGHARRDGKRRLYRLLIVPQRANLLAAREAGWRAASEEELA